MGSHNPPPSGPSVIARTHSFLPSRWDTLISQSTPFKTSILAGTRFPLQSMWDLTIHPIQGSASSLALVPLSNRCGISQFAPFRAQHPRWPSFPPPTNVGSHNPPPLRPNVLTDTHSPSHQYEISQYHENKPNFLKKTNQLRCTIINPSEEQKTHHQL